VSYVYHNDQLCKITAEPVSNSANQHEAQKAIKFMYIAQQCNQIHVHRTAMLTDRTGHGWNQLECVKGAA